MPEPYFLVVYDSILFERGHMVSRWAFGVESTFTRNAILHAPVNKRVNKSAGEPPVGSLKGSISGEADRVAPKHWQILIHVGVHYALYVIEGTGFIYPQTAPWLKLPRNAGHGGRTRFSVVPGQRANNFLLQAARDTARTHPSLRGFQNMLFEQT
jgi:hypothetical protein